MIIRATKCDDGFTFVELVVTLAIMSILVMVAVPLTQISVQRDKERELRFALIEIRSGIDAYKKAVDQGRIKVAIGESGYPKDLNELVDGMQDQRSPSKQNLYFLRKLPRDPMASSDIQASSETWRLRSYASSAEDPSEGDDVFDVYSTSDKVGLNGVSYYKW